MWLPKNGVFCLRAVLKSLIQRGTSIFAAILLLAAMQLVGAPIPVKASPTFVTIGGGDFSGVYFPTGRAIAELVNRQRDQFGIRAAVEATPGATFNLNAIAAGYQQFGLTQADKQFDAVNGRAEWAENGSIQNLRAVFSIYHESVTLVAAEDAGIEELADLKGKRVSLGNPGSSQHRIVLELLEAVGIDPANDIAAQAVFASDAPAWLEDNLIDAYFFTVGHPSETIRQALSGKRTVRLISLPGPVIEKLTGDKSYFTPNSLEIQRLYPEMAGAKVVHTISVMATLCTSAEVPDRVVYALTRAIFENLEEFRKQHPALAEFSRSEVLDGLSAELHPGARQYFLEAGLLQ